MRKRQSNKRSNRHVRWLAVTRPSISLLVNSSRLWKDEGLMQRPGRIDGQDKAMCIFIGDTPKVHTGTSTK